MKNKYAIMIFGTLFILVLDQLTKIAVYHHFKNRETMTLVENLLAFTYVGNDGAAFGLFSGYNLYFFLGVSALAVSFILYFFWTIEKERVVLATGLALIMGGALGNMLDRVRLGFVIDFIDLHHKFTIIPFNFTWPKFNVADIAILIGVVFFLFDMIRLEKERKVQEEIPALPARD